MSRYRSIQGFTLIELLVVIVVIGVLASVVLFALGGISASAAISACRADVKTVSLAVQAFTVTNGSAPTSQSQLTAEPTTYLQSWPSSPYYAISLQGGSVVVAAPIGTSPKLTSSASACDGAGSTTSSTSPPSTTSPPTTTTPPSTTTSTSTTTTTTVPSTTSTTTTTPATTTTVAPSGVTVVNSPRMVSHFYNYKSTKKYSEKVALSFDSAYSITSLDISIRVAGLPTLAPKPMKTSAYSPHLPRGWISNLPSTSGSDIVFQTSLKPGMVIDTSRMGHVWTFSYSYGYFATPVTSTGSWTVDVTTTKGHSTLSGRF